jgi:hypothetical protein
MEPISFNPFHIQPLRSHILSFLDVNDLIRIRRVCKVWKHTIETSIRLDANVYVSHFYGCDMFGPEFRPGHLWKFHHITSEDNQHLSVEIKKRDLNQDYHFKKSIYGIKIGANGKLRFISNQRSNEYEMIRGKCNRFFWILQHLHTDRVNGLCNIKGCKDCLMVMPVYKRIKKITMAKIVIYQILLLVPIVLFIYVLHVGLYWMQSCT